VGTPDRVAGTLLNMGNLYSDLGQPQKALDDYTQALPLYRQAGDRLGEGKALNNIGNMYGAPGEEQKALEYYNQALAIRRGRQSASRRRQRDMRTLIIGRRLS